MEAGARGGPGIPNRRYLLAHRGSHPRLQPRGLSPRIDAHDQHFAGNAKEETSGSRDLVAASAFNDTRLGERPVTTGAHHAPTPSSQEIADPIRIVAVGQRDEHLFGAPESDDRRPVGAP
jgi:hypothetical protein